MSGRLGLNLLLRILAMGGAATAQAFCVFAPNADAELSDIPKEPLMFEQQSACRLPEGSSESALLWSLRFWHRRAR